MKSLITKEEAIRILNNIKAGTPPSSKEIHHIHVGRKRWLEGMAWYLDYAKEANLSSVRFIVGEYGSGKTHFLRMTAHMALERQFTICEITLSSDIRLDRFNTIWQGIMEKLATPESQGDPEGIEGILNRWCEKISNLPDSYFQNMLVELDKIPQIDPDFRQAIRGYLKTWFEQGDYFSYLQWFKGDSIRPPGVRTKIDRTNSRAMLRSLIMFLKFLGYSGFVIFLDELEQIMVQNRRVRDNSYDVLRQFIDNSDNLQNFLLLCSVTPDIINDNQRGFPSYPALWQRLGGMLDYEGDKDYRAITINLSYAALNDEELFELVSKLRYIHSIAFNWQAEQAVPDDFLYKLINEAKSHAGELSLLRYIVQLVIGILDLKQQNIDKDLEEQLPGVLQQTRIKISQQERERYRSWGDN